MMKVLMLNTYDDWGGAAKAASRLNQGLRGVGIDSRLLVQYRTRDARGVIGLKNPFARVFYGMRTVFGTMPVRLYPNKPVYNFSPASMPDRLAARVAGIGPDVVHLHWIAAGFMRIETLSKLKRPLVWTLHDSWAFTGGCHMPYDCVKYRERCGQCPVLGSGREDDLSRQVWQRKEKAWRGLDLTVVAPSRWLAACAGTSSLFRGARIEVIPNGLDTSVFKPVDKHDARNQLGLPERKKLILFGGVGITRDPNKGFRYLMPALRSVAAMGFRDDAELIIFGASKPAGALDFGMKANYLGRLREDAGLALLYSAADVFVAPSVQENLPYTVMESMACGTPCVAFHQGGMSDLIDHEVTGYLARSFDEGDLAGGIGRFLKDEGTRRETSLRCRRKVEDMFALEKVAGRYAELYRTIVKHEDDRDARDRR
jgi:glycosyltransferase involved in cell wall biosynthesis